MSEQLRQQIDKPNFYTDILESGDNYKGVVSHAARVVENAKPLVATQDHEPIAYDVAHAIKPEVDRVASLEEQKKAHDPFAHAAYMEVDGQKHFIGVKTFEGEPSLIVAKADLERNAKNAAEIATKQHLGGAALAIMESKQKIADTRLR